MILSGKKMKETQLILMSSSWHRHKSETNAPVMPAESCLVTYGYSLVTIGHVWSEQKWIHYDHVQLGHLRP